MSFQNFGMKSSNRNDYSKFNVENQNYYNKINKNSFDKRNNYSSDYNKSENNSLRFDQQRYKDINLKNKSWFFDIINFLILLKKHFNYFI